MPDVTPEAMPRLMPEAVTPLQHYRGSMLFQPLVPQLDGVIVFAGLVARTGAHVQR